MDAVGHRSNRDLGLRPARKERFKELPAHVPVQTTHAVDRAGAAHRQVGHVERFRRITRVRSPQRQQVMDRNMQFLFCVCREVLLDQRRRKEIKARRDGRMSGEKIAGPRGAERDVERLGVLLHEIACTLQHGKRRMAFIEMTDLRLDIECLEQAPPRYA